MASTISAIECPNCGRSAMEDNYYKTDETFIICIRCGYSYSRILESGDEYREVVATGYGVLVLKYKDGRRQNIALDNIIEEIELAEYKKMFLDRSVDQESSYFVKFNDGQFKVILGNPPENFYLPFEEYKNKMFAKYGKSEYDYPVPIEE